MLPLSYSQGVFLLEFQLYMFSIELTKNEFVTFQQINRKRFLARGKLLSHGITVL